MVPTRYARSLIPLSLLVLLKSVRADTISVAGNATHSTLTHCGSQCEVAYTIIAVSWDPTISTITAYGAPSDIAASITSYSEYWEEYAPQSVLGTVATDWRAPDFTATCCDDAYYIRSGVTAQYSTNAAAATGDPETCAPTVDVFTGRLVGTAQSSAPTTLPFLQNDCSVSTTIIKSILTQITVVAATPNPPTGTGHGQSTWWDDTDTITIQLPITPTPYFTISPCPFSSQISCEYSVGTMNLEWEQTTITISGNASQLASLEAQVSTSIESQYDWVNASSGWDNSFGATAPCCASSVALDDKVTIDYGGYCPTTILTGYTTILPEAIATFFVQGDLADCNINIGGGIASTKTAVYLEKVTDQEDSGPGRTTTTTSKPPATKESDTLPTSTTPPVITKGTDGTGAPPRTTPRTTTPRIPPPRTTPRQQTTPRLNPPPPVQSSQAQPPPNQSSNPGNVATPSSPNNGGVPIGNNNPQPGQSSVPSNGQATALPDNAGSSTQNGANPVVNPVIPPTLAPQPSLSIISSARPIEVTTTNSAGSQVVISSFTTESAGSAVNIITTDSEGNSFTTRVTFLNPNPTSGNAGITEPGSQSEIGGSAKTTVMTVTTRSGAGIITETLTSVISDGKTNAVGGTTTGGSEGPGPSKSEAAPGSTQSSTNSKAACHGSVSSFSLISVTVITAALLAIL
ncbi:hypothetical protein TWF694_005663 [Orbilia ellipsospora]|uniref:Uncharacterized protein n=1 Tax=Orbilia ellipsospora TaxID=2528407 RepID=A0AAV9WT75_9PEZI